MTVVPKHYINLSKHAHTGDARIPTIVYIADTTETYELLKATTDCAFLTYKGNLFQIIEPE